jgi:hypothetical protein
LASALHDLQADTSAREAELAAAWADPTSAVEIAYVEAAKAANEALDQLVSRHEKTEGAKVLLGVRHREQEEDLRAVESEVRFALGIALAGAASEEKMAKAIASAREVVVSYHRANVARATARYLGAQKAEKKGAYWVGRKLWAFYQARKAYKAEFRPLVVGFGKVMPKVTLGDILAGTR